MDNELDKYAQIIHEFADDYYTAAGHRIDLLMRMSEEAAMQRHNKECSTMTNEQAIQKMQSQLEMLYDKPLLRPPPPPSPHRVKPQWPVGQDIRHFTASPKRT